MSKRTEDWKKSKDVSFDQSEEWDRRSRDGRRSEEKRSEIYKEFK